MRPRSLDSTSSEDQGKLIEPITVEPPQIKAEKGSVKENAVKGKNIISENQIVEDDPDSLAKMTVQQLRLKLRSIGVPARGSKRDLLSALKSVLESKVDEEVSWVLNDGTSSKMEQDCSNDNLKRKAKRSSASKHTRTINAVSEDHSLKRTKSAVNKKMTGDNIMEVESTVHRTKKKSIETYDISARKLSSRKRNIGSETASGVDLGVSNTVDLSANHSEPWTILAHNKPQKGWIPYNPKTMRPPPPPSNIKNVKLMSWNVNGLRALLKLEGFSALELAQRENFDVLCFQETKLQEKDVEVIKETLLEGYENSFWTCSISKLGYSGTAIISRIKPLSVRYGLGISDHDSEGRLVTAEFDSFYLLSGYVPNSGERLKRLSYRVSEWDPSLGSYMKELEKSKPVILTGDLNCANEEIDIYNPAGNRRNAGFTDEERQSFKANFLSRGFVDTFRNQHPGVVAYTYWGYRHGGRRTNKGWRLDYFLVSESISDKVHDSYILPDVTGSDHSPIGLILNL